MVSGAINRSDFTVDSTVMQQAIEAMNKVIPCYFEAVENIRNATEQLLDTSNWKGKSRDEFKETYRIIEHYLDDDTHQLSSIIDIVQGFKDIYDATDIDTAKKLYSTVNDAINDVSNL